MNACCMVLVLETSRALERERERWQQEADDFVLGVPMEERGEREIKGACFILYGDTRPYPAAAYPSHFPPISSICMCLISSMYSLAGIIVRMYIVNHSAP
jgi:hypothetical protein